MSNLKEWVVQLRYPYTALIISTIWTGTAALILVREDSNIEYLLVLVTVATMIIAVMGFSSKRR